jgi:predicted HicB family RNase H-like nuclease
MRMVTLRLDDDQHRMLAQAAEAAGCSVNEYCLVELKLKEAEPSKPIRGRRPITSGDSDD